MMRIALDGPASSGKSSVGQLAAAELGLGFLDTGLLYRAVTHRAIKLGILTSTLSAAEIMLMPFTGVRERLTEMAGATTVTERGRDYTVAVEGSLITERDLESPEVELQVPAVAAIASVRDELREVQRDVAVRGGTILAGRDIGTVVLPEAECKIFLDATAEARAARRAMQRGFAIGSSEHQRILDSLMARDREDRARPVAPLIPAEDALIIHTDHLTLEQVVDQVVAAARRAGR